MTEIKRTKDVDGRERLYRRKYDHDAILDRWAAGETSYAIGKALDAWPETIRNVVRTARRRGDPRAVAHEQHRTTQTGPRLKPDSSTGWTEARFTEAKRLYDEGCSFSQIAKSIGGGITRNAVIGMARRQGWSGRKAPGTSKRTMQRRRGKRGNNGGLAFKITSGTLGKKSATTIPDRRPPREIEDMVKSVSRDVPLMDLKPSDCRWPMNEPEPWGTWLFCGNHAYDGSSYCEYHHRLSHVPVTASQPRQDARLA